MVEERYEAIRVALAEELGSVEKQLEEHGVAVEGDEVEVRVDEGFADSAQATMERSELLALAEQLRAHRSEVLAALKRLDDGTYGKCEGCGEAIPVERLEALPAAPLCVTCKQNQQ
jgi:RNA polymerase-binding transcription factor DksA